MQVTRSLLAAALAAALTVAGVGTAQAAVGPAPTAHSAVTAVTGAAGHRNPAVHPLPGVQPLPEQLLPGARPGTGRADAKGASGDTAESGNWSGYVAASGDYQSVSSNWVQPTVSCTSDGVAAFWVGLDGDGDSTVEQDGTGVDCTSGSPRYYAWLEAYPAPQEAYDDPVAPGDSLSSTVTSLGGGEYNLTMTDHTQGWTEDNDFDSPGGENLSAEIIAEAASVNNDVTLLPDFGSVNFTGSTINGASLQTESAQPVNMVQNGTIMATTGTADTSGDFTVHYTGGSGPAVQAAYQGADGNLFTYGSAGSTELQQGMYPGTDAAITSVSGGYESAFEANTGALVVYGTAGSLNTGLGMMIGTSPSITTLANGGFEVAFQANTGSLWTYSLSAGGTDLDLGMRDGTSPSIAAVGSSYEIAFQANTTSLWGYTPATGGSNLNLGMLPGTNPSVTAFGSGFEVAIQANTGNLWGYSSASKGGQNFDVGMLVGTSPSIAAENGSFEVAFQANTGLLWTYTPASNGTDLEQGMASGTSPAITAVPGGYESAFQANTGAFVLYGSAGDLNTYQTILPGTSPSITA